jgi:hypothetical protein
MSLAPDYPRPVNLARRPLHGDLLLAEHSEINPSIRTQVYGRRSALAAGYLVALLIAGPSVEADEFDRFCRKSGLETRKDQVLVESSCDKRLELFRKRKIRIADILRLSFAHHVNHFDPAQDHTSAVQRLEPEHWPDPPLGRPMILLDPVVQIAALVDPDRFQLAP